jgi:hypothetical protein
LSEIRRKALVILGWNIYRGKEDSFDQLLGQKLEEFDFPALIITQH